MTYRRWTAEEDQALAWHFGSKALPLIAQRIGRTVPALIKRLNALDCQVRRDAPRVLGMSMADVAQELGTTPKNVRRWVERGWLEAHQVRGNKRAYWSTTHEDVTVFLQAYGATTEGLQPDVYWRDVYAAAVVAFHTRYIDAAALSAVLGVSRRTMVDWQAGRNFPRPVFRCPRIAYTERTAVIAWLNTHAQYWTAAARRELQGA